MMIAGGDLVQDVADPYELPLVEWPCVKNPKVVSNN